MLTDTIAAISTPLGEGGVSTVRISGENAIKIANQYFDNARCIMRLDVEDAERWGLDTY